MKITDLVALAPRKVRQKRCPGGLPGSDLVADSTIFCKRKGAPKAPRMPTTSPHASGWLAPYSSHGKRWLQLAGGPTPSNYYYYYYYYYYYCTVGKELRFDFCPMNCVWY